MFWLSEAYKHIFKNRDKSLKEIQDRIDCLQRSHVYIHNHITKVENDIGELKKLIVHRLAHSESYDVQMAEVN
jgi:prefoldin subunit 5